MAEKKPQMGPGETSGSGSSGAEGASAPSAAPPSAAAKGDCKCNGSTASGVQSGAAALPPFMAGLGDAAPSLRPAEGLSAGVTAWQNNKHITGLWSINQNRNSWVHVEGIGWKKLVNNSDSAIVALTMLGAHAREKGSIVNYREENDGMIYELYVW